MLFESSFRMPAINTNSASIFEVPLSSQKSLNIKYDYDAGFEAYQKNYAKAPKMIRTQNEASSFTVFDSSYFALAPNSDLDTLIFTNDRYHGVLNEGQLILNNKTELNKTTIQLGNALVDPYPNGIFYLSKQDNQLEIQVLSGNAEIGIYSADGKLKRTFLLTKFSQISAFDAFAEEGDMQIEKPVKTNELYQDFVSEKLIPTVSDIINSENIFTLNYKGQEIKPETENKLLSLFSGLSFNQKKRNYYTFLPFYIEINNILKKSQSTPVTENDIKSLKEIYLTEIANNTNAISQFREVVESKSQYIFAITADDNLYRLKVYLDTFLASSSPSSRALSELEDLYYLYPQNDFVTISESLERIKSIAPSLGKEDAIKILAILDNLAETTIQANSEDLFDTRAIISQKLTNTIEKTQFNSKTQQHLARLQNAYRLNQLTTSQIKGAFQKLLSTLDSSTQQSYQEFLLGLN